MKHIWNSSKINNGGDSMATPIGDTPILYGKEAEDFLNSLESL